MASLVQQQDDGDDAPGQNSESPSPSPLLACGDTTISDPTSPNHNPNGSSSTSLPSSLLSEPLPSEPTSTPSGSSLIAQASTTEQLDNQLKMLAVHPIYRPENLVSMAREKRASDKAIWSKNVARSFGSALKASKHMGQIEHCFVEALHPRWNRWRCACVLVRDQNTGAFDEGVSVDASSTGKANTLIADGEWLWRSFTEGTGLIPATPLSAKIIRGNESLESLDLLFYDGEVHRNVPKEDCKPMKFETVSLMEAANNSNYLRLVQLIRAGVLIPEVLRIGCSLVISVTVGNSYISETLCSFGLVEVITRALQVDDHISDGGFLMEQLARVLMNLACCDAGVVLMGQVETIERIIECVKMPILEQHCGFMYSCVKVMHNLCIGQDMNRLRFLQADMLTVIDLTKQRFPGNEALETWCERAKAAMLDFDNADHDALLSEALSMGVVGSSFSLVSLIASELGLGLDYLDDSGSSGESSSSSYEDTN